MSISINHLCFSRDELCLFDGITAILKPGQWLDVRGANGSGKSTLLRVIAGLIKPDHGHCALPSFHYIGHVTGLQPMLTVFEQIDWQCTLANHILTKEVIEQAINRLGLQGMNDTLTTRLSAGQQRRLSFAILTLIPRSLWILDEPYTALDQSAHMILSSLIEKQLRLEGMAIIATHHPINITTPPTQTIQLKDLSCYSD